MSEPIIEGGKVQTLNITAGKGGTRIDARKYAALREAILQALREHPDGLSFKALPDAVLERLPGGEIPGGGSIMWYLTVVKLDLEARGLVERVKGKRPQWLRAAGE